MIISFAHLNTAAPPAQEDAGEKGVVRRAVETTRIVVLRDEHNLLYAIPFPVVERMRVSGDEAAELARALDEEPDPFSGNRFTGRLLLWSSVDDA